MVIRILAALLAFLLGGLAASGDVLEFQNGDRLSGRYIKTQDGLIYFQSATLGVVRVPEEEAEVVTEEEPSFLPLEPIASILSSSEAAEAGIDLAMLEKQRQTEVQQAEEIIEEEEKTLLEENIFYRTLARLNPLKAWVSTFSVGYVWQKGEKDEEEWTLRFQSERVEEDSEYLLSARREYAQRATGDESTDTTKDLTSAAFRYRYNVSEGFFLQSNSRYLRDLIKGIEHEATQSFGIGYRYLDLERWQGTVTPATTIRYRELSTGTEEDRWRYLITLFQDLRFQVNDRLTLVEEAQGSVDVEDPSRRNYNFALRLSNKITDKLKLDLAYEHEFDQDLAEGVSERDQRIIALLGIEF